MHRGDGMNRLLVPLFAVLGGLALSQVVACDEDLSPSQEADCVTYCERANECDDVDQAECEEECKDALSFCFEDEIEDAATQLDECSAAACDDFTGCTVDVTDDCFFGL